MKRLALISCFVVFFAGIASAWANCTQNSFSPAYDSKLPRAAHTQDHHSDSNHHHSNESVIHCATSDDFLITANVSVSKSQHVERLASASLTELDFQSGRQGSCRSSHGPPNFSRSRILHRICCSRSFVFRTAALFIHFSRLPFKFTCSRLSMVRVRALRGDVTSTTA